MKVKEIYLHEFNKEERSESKPKIIICNDLEVLLKCDADYRILINEYPDGYSDYLQRIVGSEIYVTPSKETAIKAAEYLYNTY